MKYTLLFVLLFCIFKIPAIAQQDTSQVIITLKDNSWFSGKIIAEDSISISILTSNKIKMQIPRQEIEQIRRRTKDKLYAFDDPNDTRLFFAPTARSLKQGEGYIADYWVFFPFVAVGAFDRLILSGGITLLPGADEQLFYFAPKVAFVQNKIFGVAAGIIYMNLTSLSEDGVGIAYGVSTFGDSDLSGTLGVGWAYSGSDINEKPVLLLGGEARVSQSIKLISENWILPNTEYSLLSFGIRFFGKQLAADLALVYPFGADMDGGFPFFPWLSFAYNF